MQRSAFTVASFAVEVELVDDLQCVTILAGSSNEDGIALVACFAVDSLLDFLAGRAVSTRPEGALLLFVHDLFSRQSGFLRYKDGESCQTAFLSLELKTELLRMLEEVRVELGL